MSMLCLLVVNAQPQRSLCKEDAHCSVGYYCETQENLCYKCLRCQDLKRDPPKLDISDKCIKSINTCGPCSEGFVNIYRNDVKDKCVSPELFDFGRPSQYAYVWITAVIIGMLIVVIFVYVITVINHTDVLRIMAHYPSVSVYSPPDGTSVSAVSSPRHIWKNLDKMLHLNKNLSNQ